MAASIDQTASGQIKTPGDFACYKHVSGKSVFVRLIGDNGTLAQSVLSMDKQCAGKNYLRIRSLPVSADAATMAQYSKAYDAWEASGKRRIKIGITEGSSALEYELGEMFTILIKAFSDSAGKVSASVSRNFIIMMLYRLDVVFNKKYPQDGFKLVCSNVVKLKEYLFFYIAALIGANVLLIQNKADIDETANQLFLSAEVRLGGFSSADIPEFVKSPAPNQIQQSGNVKLKIPPKPGRKPYAPPTQPDRSSLPVFSSGALDLRPGNNVSHARELTYEELALRSAGVVQIFLLNSPDDITPQGIKAKASGSGVMIGRDGYILTNCHVAKGGVAYGVRIENDDTICFTKKLVKYHDKYDLAVLKIDRKLEPLPVYAGPKKLVRGQRVVAIGSPLGLFNTISDGIISGFRNVDDIEMIQFTAPISSGSSGGALMNMYGEVIGISSAGVDSKRGIAQNINLAIGYTAVRTFCGNIIDR